MRRISILALACLCLAFAVSCKKAPPPEPTAQEYFDSGMRYFNQEQYQMALSEFELATMKSPSFVEANYYVGLAAWKLNMTERAKKAFVDTLSLNPNHIKGRESLGILHYTTGDFGEAKRHLEAARNLNSINPEAYFCLGRIYVMEGKCPEALKVFEKGIQVDSAYLPLKNEYEAAKRGCGKGGGAAKAPPVIQEKKFRGGGKAIDPSDF